MDTCFGGHPSPLAGFELPLTSGSMSTWGSPLLLGHLPSCHLALPAVTGVLLRSEAAGRSDTSALCPCHVLCSWHGPDMHCGLGGFPRL